MANQKLLSQDRRFFVQEHVQASQVEERTRRECQDKGESHRGFARRVGAEEVVALEESN